MTSIADFLKENKLKKYITQFEDEEIDLDDLKKWDKKKLNKFVIKPFGMNELHQERLLDGIKALKPQKKKKKKPKPTQDNNDNESESIPTKKAKKKPPKTDGNTGVDKKSTINAKKAKQVSKKSNSNAKKGKQKNGKSKGKKNNNNNNDNESKNENKNNDDNKEYIWDFYELAFPGLNNKDIKTLYKTMINLLEIPQYKRDTKAVIRKKIKEDDLKKKKSINKKKKKKNDEIEFTYEQELMIPIVRIIRDFVPGLMLNGNRPVVGVKRIFKITSSPSGNVYISDYDKCYRLVDDEDNPSRYYGELYSNHSVAHSEATELCADQNDYIWFRQKTARHVKEAIHMIDNKRKVKRKGDGYKIIGSRYIWCEPFIHADKIGPYSVVFLVNGPNDDGDKCEVVKYEFHDSKPKKNRVTKWKVFDGTLPDYATMICVNHKHDTVFMLYRDTESMYIELLAIKLNKQMSNIVSVKTWDNMDEMDFYALGENFCIYWTRQYGGCVVCGMKNEILLFSENKNGEFSEYSLGKIYGVNMRDMCDDPLKKRSILVCDGAIILSSKRKDKYAQDEMPVIHQINVL